MGVFLRRFSIFSSFTASLSIYRFIAGYQQVAQLSSRKRAYRAVGQALHRNPIPLIIPCHRVVAKSSLGGFGYGLDWKLRLLTLENIQL